MLNLDSRSMLDQNQNIDEQAQEIYDVIDSNQMKMDVSYRNRRASAYSASKMNSN